MPLFTISELPDSFAAPSHEQILDVSGTEPVLSEPLGEFTAYVRLESDEDLYVAFGGDDVVAIHGNFPIPCCTPVVVQASPGMRISALNQNAPLPAPPEVVVEDEFVADNTLPAVDAEQIDHALKGD